MKTTFRLGELFCGPGGIALGAKMASTEANPTNLNIAHAWATDYDRDTCKTYSQNICGIENSKSVIHADIRKLDIKTLEKISGIDALAFGFPCNDFSIVGEQKGIDGVFGPLYQYGINVLEHFQPDWFLAENVGGLRNSNDGNAFQTILDKMYDAGYDTVPQARH